ncbi:MAG TPA: gliding motility-associated C-terminal domain-containing protein [Puia sp.]|nr:gliding motility-associated C-terminal domain-containing protein [Puia sp.]
MARKHRYTFLLTAFFLFSLSPGTKAQPAALTLIVHTIAPSCNASSGLIILTAAGGTPPYTFFIKGINVGAGGSFSGLPTGVYPVSVTDAAGTTASQTVTLTQTVNPPQVTVSAYTNPTGCGKDDGTITLTATGGTPPYTYTADDITWQTSNTFTNLPADAALALYPLSVRDANGCLAWPSNSPILVSNCPITISGWNYNSLLFGCGSTKGYIHITAVSGGTPPYTYSLDGVNYQSSPDFDNLPAGNYHLRVQDAAGLITFQAFVIDDECALTATYVAIDASCAHNDGSITVTAQNANPPYTYSIDGLNYQTSNIFTGLTSGTYRVIVRDLYGATFNLLATVFDDCPIVTVITSNDICGSGKGSITADGSNGTAPYQYSIDGVNYQSAPLFPNLPAGNYTVYIKDARGQTNSTGAVVGNTCLQVSAIPTSSTCGKPNGTLTAAAANGVSPYQYSIDGTNFQYGTLFKGLLAGNYTVTAKDASNAQATTTVTITDIAGPRLAAITTPATCLNNDGGIVASNIGGNGPFQYSLDGVNYQPGGTFTALPTGAQLIYIEDANGCTASQPVAVPLNNNLAVNAGPDTKICAGNSVTFPAQSNGLSFSWSPATGLSNPSILDPVASPQSTTQYTLTASTAVCSSTASVTVVVDTLPVANAGKDTAVCAGSSVRLQGSGGQCSWSPRTWLDNPASSTPTVVAPAQTITYQLTVTDANGCSSLHPAKVTVTVTPPPELFAGNDTSVLAGQPVPLNAVDVNNSGFNSYTWSPASGLSNAFVQNPIAYPAGSMVYTVVASTADGCTATAGISIKVYEVSDIFVPSGFTPNGDGHNDLLKAIPIGIRDFKYFVVYNRWGQRVFQTADPAIGWDGTLNGQSQSTGAFVWMAAGVDYKGTLIQRKGTTILIR